MQSQFADRVSFRKVTRDDLELIHQWWNNPKIMSALGAKNFSVTLEELKTEYLPSWLDPKPGGFNMFILCYDGKAIGEIGYRLTDVEHKIADFNIKVCDLDHRNQGIGTYAMGAFIHLLFKEEKVNRIICGLREDNKPALSLYGRLGFSESRRYEFEESFEFSGGIAIEMVLDANDFIARHPEHFA